MFTICKLGLRFIKNDLFILSNVERVKKNQLYRH